MNIPKGMTADEVTAIISKIAKRLAPKFKFGYYEVNDIEQEAFILGIEGLKDYDEVRPLENFLWVHIRNRLKNLKRNEFERHDKPCLRCRVDAYDKIQGCSQYEDPMACKPYKKWHCRNQTKKNLMAPIGFDNVRDEQEERMKIYHQVDDIIANRELQDIIDDKLPIYLRADYLRLLSDVHISKPRRVKVQEAIREILTELDDDT